jgi:hypothetical protein
VLVVYFCGKITRLTGYWMDLAGCLSLLELNNLERKMIMNHTHKIHILLLTGLVISLLAACGPQETVLGEEESDVVLAFSEQKTDNLLAGMKAGDYAAFSQDFDQQMLDAMTETQFEALKRNGTRRSALMFHARSTG